MLRATIASPRLPLSESNRERDMCKAIVWLEEQPAVTVDAAGVRIEYESGDDRYVRRCTRAFMRRHCENTLAAIDRFEAAEALKVIPMRAKPRRGGRPPH